jgi:hypothetical protein
MDPVTGFLIALGVWLILTEVILPDLDAFKAEVVSKPTELR